MNKPSIWHSSVLAFVLAASFASSLQSSLAAEDPKAPAAVALNDDEAKAWEALKDVAMPPAQPEEWKTNRPTREVYQAFMLKHADAASGRIAAYLAKYPTGEHAKQARKWQMSVLQMAAAMGSKEKGDQLAAILTEIANDPTQPENDRVNARLSLLRTDVAKSGGDRAATMKAAADGLIALLKDFPKSELIYTQMMGIVSDGGAEANRLAKFIVGSPDAPAKIKQKAQDVLDGKVFSAAANIGKPVDIKFTAVDGTAVDLGKMKGKVVLVDFWATWCGPCVAEIPNVVAAYEKYHDKGFEIIGISFDREADKEKLIQFTKDKKMPWPQYFDGKHWENDFGQRFNIRGIPTMWLFDKNGKLVDAEARKDLADKVDKLIQAK